MKIGTVTALIFGLFCSLPALAESFSGPACESLGRGGNWQGCRDYAVRWTTAQPSNGLAWYDLGYASMNLHDYNGAVQAFTKATERVPTQPKPWNDLSAAYCKLNQFDQATATVKRGVAASGAHCGAQDWYVFGNALKELRQYNDAVSCYDHALAKSPSFREALNNKGICMQAMGDEGAAQGLYNRSSRLGNSIAGENAANLREVQNQRNRQQSSLKNYSSKAYNDFIRDQQNANAHQ